MAPRKGGKPAIEVEPRGDQGWARQKQGTSRAGSLHSTKQAAVDAARRQAQRERTELIIKGKDGTIQKRDSSGNDPRSRKG